jgi:large subunit ribosomal protein L35
MRPSRALDARLPGSKRSDQRPMPKQKTHKGIRKRFKVTATGKVKHKKAFRGHKLAHKGGKRNRQARADRVVEGKQVAMIRHALLPSL